MTVCTPDEKEIKTAVIACEKLGLTFGGVDILENGDPNGLVNLIQKFKKHINGLDINGKIADYKKKDKRFLNFKLINKKANRLDKQLIQKMYYHANVD